MRCWLALASVLSACGSGSGASCTVASDCHAGLVCLASSGADAATGGVCTRLCDHDAGDGVDQHLCSDGTVCASVSGARVCYGGGNHAIHTACTSDADCEAGTVCATDTMTCEQACTVGTNAPCAMGETCQPIVNGICRPTAIVVDGGVDA
jgi:hypothetical protein